MSGDIMFGLNVSVDGKIGPGVRNTPFVGTRSVQVESWHALFLSASSVFSASIRTG